MPKKMRHSKFRNSGILFELLVRQITADIIAGKETSGARDLLFKYFKETTELGKEWRLYGYLLNEKLKDQNKAERFLNVVVEQRKRLSNAKLSKEKYSLIRELKDLYPIDYLLKANIKNYRTLASIFKLFEDASTIADAKFDAKELYQAKTCIVEHISDRTSKKSEDDDTIRLYEQQNEEVRLLTYRLLVEGVNKKYANLDDNQKSVLREYINNVSNTNSLGSFIQEKIQDIKQQLESLMEKIDSDVVKIKINEVHNQLNSIKPSRIVKDNHVMVVLLAYELLKECRSAIGKINE